MASGPTQNYDDPTLVAWRPHRTLARVLRVALAALPVAVAVGASLLAVRFLPPARVGLNPWLWLAIEVTACALLLSLVGRVSRRLLPLTTLLKLTLVLPDRVPSRAAAVRRAYSPDRLHDRVQQAGGHGPDPNAVLLLELVAALGRHDRATFRHSERVQGYSALIGHELGLSPDDVARLSWAALLHDVGKLTVPVDVLNKPSKPDAAEWAAISGHAAAGGELAEPLARWLGPWAAAIDEHHERWDGGGYPRGLSGDQISLGARIVAVADAYDVITSVRAYKTALPAEAARAELLRCAGAQFDPAVVRAFLAVGLGELRRVTGPLALVGTMPVIPLLQQGAARALGRSGAAAGSTTTAAAAVVPGVAAAMVVGAGLAVATPVLSEPPTTDAETVVTDAGPGGSTGALDLEGTSGAPRPAGDPGALPAGTDGSADGELPQAGTDVLGADPSAIVTDNGDGMAGAATGDEGSTAGDADSAPGASPAPTGAPAPPSPAASPTPTQQPPADGQSGRRPTLPPTAADPAREHLEGVEAPVAPTTGPADGGDAWGDSD